MRRGVLSPALTSVNLLRPGGEPWGKVLLDSRSHYTDQYAEVPEAEQLTPSRHRISKLRAGPASRSLWVTGPKRQSPCVSGGFREVGGLSSPSRSGSVSPSSASATSEARGEWLGSLGRPSERGTALQLPKATAGGGTPSNRHGCHASLAGVPGPRPWVHTLSRREWEGTPGGRGPAHQDHVRRTQCGDGGPAGGPCLGGHGEGLGAASALRPPRRARPVSQRGARGLGRGARPGLTVCMEQWPQTLGPLPGLRRRPGLEERRQPLTDRGREAPGGGRTLGRAWKTLREPRSGPGRACPALWDPG